MTSVAADCKPVHQNLKTVVPCTLTGSTLVSPSSSALARAGADLGGLDGEVVNEIGALECLTVNAAPVTGAVPTEGVKSNRSGVTIGGACATPVRAQEFSLGTTMYRGGIAFVSRDGVNTVASMQTRELGVMQASPGMTICRRRSARTWRSTRTSTV